MNPTAIATRYATALADVVTGPKSTTSPSEVLEQLRRFEFALASSEELRHVLSAPAVPASRKKAVVSRIGKAISLSTVVINFLFVLIDHRRIPIASEAIEAFDILIDERLGFARAEVKSAFGLDQRQRDALAAELAQLTGKQVRVKFEVDEALIGGAVARVGSVVYDGSVKGQLQTLARQLAAE